MGKETPAKESVTVEGATFVIKSWEGKTLEDFVKHEKATGLSEEQLKEAWGLMFPAKKK